MSGLLVITVLLSALSHTISLHLCQGDLQVMALFNESKSCTEATRSCDQHEASFDAKSCCQDITISVAHAEAFNVSGLINFDFFQPALLSNSASASLSDSNNRITKSHAGYKRPIIERDITTLVHKFLI